MTCACNAPRLIQQASSLTTAVTRWAGSGFEGVTDEQLASRKAICATCDDYDAAGFFGNGKCLKCGCVLDFKQRLATEPCPVGKW
jgi:hypothetical protein